MTDRPDLMLIKTHPYSFIISRFHTSHNTITLLGANKDTVTLRVTTRLPYEGLAKTRLPHEEKNNILGGVQNDTRPLLDDNCIFACQ
jgi:hypothetical protein